MNTIKRNPSRRLSPGTRWVFLVIALFAGLLAGCANKPRFMKYDTVFFAEIGDGTNQVGSNLPLLAAWLGDKPPFTITDKLDLPDGIRIARNRIYIADKYNRRVSVFPVTRGSATNSPILPTGEGYSFGIPFQVVLNKYGEIFVLASLSNDTTAAVARTNQDNRIEFLRPRAATNFNQYYIYKFSPDGKFILLIGENGIHSGPMEYPDRLETDLFDNLYAYYRDFEGDRSVWTVKRFSPSGELTFEFSTRYVSPTNVSGDKTYLGHVSDVYNLKNDERLMIFTEYALIRKGDKALDTPDEFFNSIDVYSVLQNAITRNVLRSKKWLDEFQTVTRDDVLVLHSFDERFKGIRFRFLDASGTGGEARKEEVYYAPVISDNFLHLKFIVDETGQIYSVIVKDNRYFVLLKWRKVKTRMFS